MRKEYIGQNCPYCKTALVETDMIAVCGVCNVPQHLSCWQKNKGCTTVGCTGFITEIIESDSTVQTAPQAEPELIEQPTAPLEKQKEKLPELLYESREMVFMSDLPIVLEHTTMTMDYAQDKLLACCTFRSITDKAIKAVVTQIICQDAEGHALGTPVTFRYRNLQTKRGTKFGQKVSIDLPDHGTRKLRVTAQKVVFADDTEITGGDRVFTSPAPVLLSEHFGSSDLAAQYARETTAEAQFVPIGGGKYWFCTCGALNESFETRCHNCGCTKKQLVTALDPETLKINLSCYEAQNAEAERAEKAKAKKFSYDVDSNTKRGIFRRRENEEKAPDKNSFKEFEGKYEIADSNNKGINIKEILSGLDEEQLMVYNFMPEDKLMSAESFLELNIEISDIIALLSMLEISGAIEQRPGGLYLKRT